MPILNSKRLRDYPRLMLFSIWTILAINLLLHQGWIGGFGQVIVGDFIMFYSTGLIYRSSPTLIYDYDTQMHTQQALVAPTHLPGFNPYMNPPFMAPIYSFFTNVPLHWAIVIWTALSILAAFLSMYLLVRLISKYHTISKPSYWQLIIILFSFFPFIEGMQAGQNHWLTLLLVTGIIYAMFSEKWYIAGALAGILLYKPQFTFGFIIIWIVWKNWKALLSFAVVALTWTGIFALTNGLDLYRTYLHMSQAFMNLPYIAGFPNYLMVTVYGFLTSIFPEQAQPYLSILSQAILVISAVGLAWLASKSRASGMVQRVPVIVLALIFPLLASPYALLHDMVILVPACVLWGIYSDSRYGVYTFVIIYLGTFFLTLLGALTKIAWVSLLVISLPVAIIVWLISKPKPVYGTNALP